MSADSSPAALVSLRDQREKAIQHLTDSYLADHLDVEQFEERLSRVHAATTIAQLEALLGDLAPLPAGTETAALAPLSVNPTLPASAASASHIRAVLGNTERRGGWVVPAQLRITATFGNVELDFREARFTAAVTELEVRVVLGNLEITVPPQLAVECEGSSVLGNIENHGTGAVGDPERPLLRIRGIAVLGNVEVHTRLPRGSDPASQKRLGRPSRPQLPGRQQ